MKYMLDTNTCIYLMKGKPACVREKMLSLHGQEFFLSSIVISELWFGVFKSQQVDKNTLILKCFLEPFTELTYGDAANQVYGNIRAKLQKMGTPIGSLDMLIAAHALAESACLVSNNTKEFSRVEGLVLENWIV
ncbi:type II toxin-antitoxin system VapC family toxin [Candidatus Venteria ishoeyi]|uniref:type II toxin-antitoxin system tRNA(fMet)-specific endonuclease VapC n=1 Tax=Candidatus Venteria ishoeyi TaxID=1899563 RepID=UPI0025A59273|nr:type II toxin-antitoxin system VapC family toxin [Candidatus Venteria ishoeyi]MDM8545815.1 type II toxin-antitoxin system VapC family toxin [Candidatus Venteria ishoeyi]